jgi:hypothetical protein
MYMNSGRSVRIFGVVLLAVFLVTVARGQGADSLESQLGAKYKLAKLGTDSSGLSVTDAGTVLVIKKGGVLSVASGNMVVVPSYVKDGQVKAANNTAMAGVNKLLKWKAPADPTGAASSDTKFLTVGEKVYPTKIDINRKDSKVTVAIIECDSCNSVQDRSSRKAQLVFQFPKDYLSGADGGQISDVINQILEINTDEGGDQQQQGQAAQGQQQAAAQPPPTIQIGQSPDDVKGLLGQPEKVVNLGAKQIFVYKDLKVTFINGKVADVQ